MNLSYITQRSYIIIRVFFKKLAKLFKIITNPFKSYPSSAILVPFCFRITPLLFFFLSKPFFPQHLNCN